MSTNPSLDLFPSVSLLPSQIEAIQQAMHTRAFDRIAPTELCLGWSGREPASQRLLYLNDQPAIAYKLLGLRRCPSVPENELAVNATLPFHRLSRYHGQRVLYLKAVLDLRVKTRRQFHADGETAFLRDLFSVISLEMPTLSSIDLLMYSATCVDPSGLIGRLLHESGSTSIQSGAQTIFALPLLRFMETLHAEILNRYQLRTFHMAEFLASRERYVSRLM